MELHCVDIRRRYFVAWNSHHWNLMRRTVSQALILPLASSTTLAYISTDLLRSLIKFGRRWNCCELVTQWISLRFWESDLWSSGKQSKNRRLCLELQILSICSAAADTCPVCVWPIQPCHGSHQFTEITPSIKNLFTRKPHVELTRVVWKCIRACTVGILNNSNFWWMILKINQQCFQQCLATSRFYEAKRFETGHIAHLFRSQPVHFTFLSHTRPGYFVSRKINT